MVRALVVGVLIEELLFAASPRRNCILMISHHEIKKQEKLVTVEAAHMIQGRLVKTRVNHIETHK